MSKPTIEIGIDFEQLRVMADRASKLLKDKLGKTFAQGAQAGIPGMGPGGGAKVLPFPQPKLPPGMKPKKGGLLEGLLFGERGEKDAVRGIKQSIAQIGDTLSETLGANKVGLGNIGSKVGGFGLVGGAGIAMGGMAAAGLAGSIMYGRSKEHSMMSMAPFMGGKAAMHALGLGRKSLFDDEETASMANPLARSGALGGLGAVLKGQRGLGVGGDLSEVLGAQAGKGGKVTNRSANRELSQAVGAAVATGLDRGRIGELLKGAAQMMHGRGLGIGQSNSGIYGALGRVGGSFKGAEGVQAIGGLEQAMRNPTTALGKNIALRVAGLGGKMGGDIYGAERQMELGFFGEGKNGAKGSGVGGIDKMLGMYRKAYGFGEKQQVGQTMTGVDEIRRGAMIKDLSQNMGQTQTGAEAIVNAVEQGKSQAEIEKLMKEGKPLQDKAYEALIGMGNFKQLEKAFQESFREMWGVLGPLILKLMKLVEELLKYFTPKAVGAIQSGMEGGKILSTAEGRAKAVKAIPGAVSEFVSQSLDAVGRRKMLLKLARTEGTEDRLGGLTAGPHDANDTSASEKQASDVMKQLIAAENLPVAGGKRDLAEANVFSSMDNDQLQQVTAILTAALKAHPVVVNVHNAPGVKADAHTVHASNTTGTALAPATKGGH